MPDLTWTAPKGWIVDPPKPMRHFTYHAGTNTECYLSILGGSAGGLERNVNRWRREIGLDPLSAQEIAKLDSAPMLGGNATLIEGSGTFQGVSGPPRDGFRLLGLILPSPGRTFFLKMVGPAAEVETLRDGFLFLAQSIEIKN